MEKIIKCSNGLLLEEMNLKSPKLVASSEEISRPGYSNIVANEFEDYPEVLKEKVNLACELIKNAKNVVIYTGAGISRASGIADYASKAKQTRAGR